MSAQPAGRPVPPRPARVVLDEQVWVIHPSHAERLAVYPAESGVQLWPLRAGAGFYDTTAPRPMWPGGVPHPRCTRWAVPADLSVSRVRSGHAEGPVDLDGGS
jgi:hypothetical protein